MSYIYYVCVLKVPFVEALQGILWGTIRIAIVVRKTHRD